MNAHISEDDPFPPTAPTDESPMPDDRSFVELCLANTADVAAAGQWQVGAQLLTHSDTWGKIWRADFTIPGDDVSPLINRMICWQRDGNLQIMFAIAQSDPPL